MTEFTLLAGTNEAGINSMLVTHKSKSMLVNVGAGYLPLPYAGKYGVAIPEVELEGVFITSFSENDAGALLHLIKTRPELDVFASEITKKVLEQELWQQGINPNIQPIGSESHLHSSGISVRFIDNSKIEAGNLGVNIATSDGSITYLPTLSLPLHAKLPKTDLLISSLQSCSYVEELMAIAKTQYSKRTLIVTPRPDFLVKLVEFLPQINGRIILLGNIASNYRAIGKHIDPNLSLNPKMVNRPTQHPTFIVINSLDILSSYDVKIGRGDTIIYNDTDRYMWYEKLETFAHLGVKIHACEARTDFAQMDGVLRQLQPKNIMLIGAPAHTLTSVSALAQIPIEGKSYTLHDGTVAATTKLGSYLRLQKVTDPRSVVNTLSICVQLPTKEDPISIRNLKFKHDGIAADGLLTKLRTRLIAWLNDNRKLDLANLEAGVKKEAINFWQKYQSKPPIILVTTFLSARA